MMGNIQWQIKQARDHFSELVDKAAAGTSQLVIKNGKPIVYVIN